MKWDVEVNDPCRSRCSVKAEPVEYTETKPQRQKLLYHMTQESITVSLMLREKLDQKKKTSFEPKCSPGPDITIRIQVVPPGFFG